MSLGRSDRMERTGFDTGRLRWTREPEEHQIGDYMYDLEIPDWERIPSAIRTSWRDKIFKRG